MKMDFGKALNMLRNGKLLRRRAWGMSAHILLVPESADMGAMLVEVASGTRPVAWMPRHEDLMAEDWEIA
jgi:hypothetical protein